MSTSSLLVLALLAGTSGGGWASQQTPTRVRSGRVALEGPLERAELRFADGSATVLELALAAGERRVLEVPLAPPQVASESEPRIEVRGAGSGAFVGWMVEEAASAEQAWGRLPPGLRQRPRPPAPAAPDAGRPPPAALLLCAAAFLLALRWRGRGGVALPIGAGGAAALLALTAGQPPSREVLALLEGDGASGRWVAVRVARDRLELPAGATWRITTEPAQVPLRIAGHDLGGILRWSVESARATLHQTEILDLAPDTLTRAGSNRLGLLERTWVRDPDGRWTRRGRWALGQPLPEALDGPGEPPGWLNPALPMGTGVLIAQRPSAQDPAGPGEARVRGWVRVVGF